MPGPVSDSYDPEFGTAANAQEVRDAIDEVIKEFDRILKSPRRDILQVVRSPERPDGDQIYLSQRQQRIIRFSLHRAKETI